MPQESNEKYDFYKQRVADIDAATLFTGLLDEVETMWRRFVVLPDDSLQTLTLWAMHTYFFEFGHATPYISINSATMREGKTRVMETASLVVRNPLMSANISTAALYRTVDAEQPSLFIDEFDQAARVTELPQDPQLGVPVERLRGSQRRRRGGPVPYLLPEDVRRHRQGARHDPRPIHRDTRSSCAP